MDHLHKEGGSGEQQPPCLLYYDCETDSSLIVTQTRGPPDSLLVPKLLGSEDLPKRASRLA